ncbi:TIGR01244 family sulfur transferase [Kordiimonas sp. SCSIO 12610]|uniref:TIGR01244 family sulfur transferase n=1 Tax=Kordiimonas sp. SCSIO 12610 TaxID=2829597 RepID=UPI00210D512E|nr:TIGR01244 family sulfur transferase [Kordiimonas sp. SCSIO 12610]UTW55256.1 TIGR01244 family phosphatase [Kordiimonas sp. SCSIO 12610]
MAEFKKLDENFTVSTQMTKADFAEAAQMGVKTIICNRVEGEEAGQPLNITMMSNAAEHDMDFAALPVGGTFPIEEAGELAKLLRETSDPIHGYCKSGTRSAMLWGLAVALNRSKTPNEIMAITSAAGFDLSNIEPAFHQFYESAQRKQ